MIMCTRTISACEVVINVDTKEKIRYLQPPIPTSTQGLDALRFLEEREGKWLDFDEIAIHVHSTPQYRGKM